MMAGTFATGNRFFRLKPLQAVLRFGLSCRRIGAGDNNFPLFL
jgi:hypothetical protein